MAGVFCIGIATLDYVYGIETLPTRGEKYRSRDLAIVGGGCAANGSAAIARLGGRVWLAARLGDDLTGDRIMADLVAEGVEPDFFHRVPGMRSPVSAILVDAEGERMVVSYSDPTMPEAIGWLPSALPQGTGAVLADTRWGDGAHRMLSLAREAGLPGVLDSDRQPSHPGLLSAASHVAFSAQALREISGEDDPRLGLMAAARHSNSWLAVTLGPEGVLYLAPDGVHHVPGFAVKAVDTLGAGDVWHGAFALALAEGQGEEDAIRFASAVAAIKCTRFGGRAGTPTRAELDAFLAAAR